LPVPAGGRYRAPSMGRDAVMGWTLVGCTPRQALPRVRHAPLLPRQDLDLRETAMRAFVKPRLILLGTFGGRV
jgi:hypothetical protein